MPTHTLTKLQQRALEQLMAGKKLCYIPSFGDYAYPCIRVGSVKITRVAFEKFKSLGYIELVEQDGITSYYKITPTVRDTAEKPI